MALDVELRYYTSRKDEFVRAYSGQFVVIKGEEFLGAFTTQAQAYEAGLSKWGNVPFLIKQVWGAKR